MSYLNQVIIIGNLGKDPEVRYLQSGNAVAQLNVCTTETWKDAQGEKQERSEWHRIEVWGKAAEFCAKYLSKGNKILAQGSLRTDKYEKDGVTHYTTKIVAQILKSLTPRTGGQTPAQHNLSPQEQSPRTDLGFGPEDDDIPF
jgi:single-strand DNA-binding protein